MKILMCGYFAFDINDNGGQPVKTRQIFYSLSEKYGKESIDYIETPNWKRNPVKLLAMYFVKARKADVIIMLPAHNGVEVFGRLLLFSKILWKKRIFYSVIGGWLPKKIENNKQLKRCLKKFDGLWVETSSMKKALENQLFNNITVIPNFKALKVLKKSELRTQYSEPYKLCTFARVMKEKGIEDAIQATTQVNQLYGKVIFSLDIYGQIDGRYLNTFQEMQKEFPEYIKYMGVVKPENSVSVICNYYALLFPTHFYTEGIPGTLIDALFAGLPVISPRWINCDDILIDGVTGYSYEFDDYNQFVSLLIKIYSDPERWIAMKKNCICVAQKFTPDYAVNIIEKIL